MERFRRLAACLAISAAIGLSTVPYDRDLLRFFRERVKRRR